MASRIAEATGTMLYELRVEHLGPLEDLHLVLGPGLTVLTGETGAGKSLIIDAIGLLTGGRGSPDLVRPGADETRVEGRFVHGDDETVVARVQPRSGRSRAYVDGHLATAAYLANLGEGWLDVHVQNGQQSLLRRAAQREALDRYAHVDLAPLARAREELTELEAELAALGGDERARARELDLLEHQITEIQNARIEDVLEDDRLEEEQDRLADAVAYRLAGEEALAAFQLEGGALDALRRAVRSLDGRRPYGDLSARLKAVVAELDDVADTLRHEVDQIEENPERLERTVARRQRLRDLRRRYGDTLTDVLEFLRDAQRRRDEVASYERRARELEDRRQQALHKVERCARVIGDARRLAAPHLSEAVTTQVRRLALPQAVINITVGDAATDPAGDVVTFMFSAHEGWDPMPLGRVASGGELSRVMLALRLVLGGGPATLIFDEVDAGLGGAAVEAVAQALADVAREHQVLVVTHLAHVAARADHHLVVEKQSRETTTVTSVSEVRGQARVVEIARMLSGKYDNQRALAYAAEMLGNCQA